MKTLITILCLITPLPAETKPELIDFRFNFDIDLVSNLEIFKPTMAAYACSPSRRESIEKITSVSITSNNKMVTDKGVFDAGDELYKIFGTTYKGLPTPVYDLYLSLMPSFKMMEASEHAFTVVIMFDDGRTFEFESDSYQFVP